MATERRWIEGRTELDETRDGPSRKKNGGDEFGRTTKTNDPTKKTKWRGKRERDILYGRERARPGRPVVVGGRQNSPSQVRPDSQNMTGTLSVLFFPPSFFSPPSFSFSVSFPPTLPACRDGTNRPKVMDSPPALGLGCRMRWYIPPSTRCVERIVYSSVSFASSVVIFFLSSVLRWALRILLYRFSILGMNPCLRGYFLGIITRDFCRKALPHYLLIFMCRHLEMYYYFVHLLRFYFLA
jgi:hypothetical protein